MLAMEADTSLDLSVLEDLDFPVQCGHSGHASTIASNYGRHRGTATHVCRVLHHCPVRPDAFGTTYPACTTWAEFVVANEENAWECPRCKEWMPFGEAVMVVGPLE